MKINKMLRLHGGRLSSLKCIKILHVAVFMVQTQHFFRVFANLVQAGHHLTRKSQQYVTRRHGFGQSIYQKKWGIPPFE
ncbi:MAG: hypothetical protein ACI8Z5_001923 [Lentimonas sp.]|jgi:hypothetical protein